MKLINPNKFKEKLDYLNYELYNSHPVGELSKEEKDTVSWFIQHISKMVDNMPTEDVIPIEWIKKQAEDGWYDIIEIMYHWELENNIKKSILWSEENETN